MKTKNKRITKSFDCVEFMHKQGMAIQGKTRNMTVEQQVSFWKKRELAIESKIMRELDKRRKKSRIAS